LKTRQIKVINKTRSSLLSGIAVLIHHAPVLHLAFHFYAQTRDFAETAVLKLDRAKAIYNDRRAKAAARIHIS
jgi:hypothetical protein